MRQIGLRRGGSSGLRLGAGALAACGLVTGCTAILGSYEVDPSLGPGGDAGGDAVEPPVTEAGDAQGVDAGGLPFRCAPEGAISSLPPIGPTLGGAWRVNDRIVLLEVQPAAALATVRSFVPGDGSTLRVNGTLADVEEVLAVRKRVGATQVLALGAGRERAANFAEINNDLAKMAVERLALLPRVETRGALRFSAQGTVIGLWTRTSPNDGTVAVGRVSDPPLPLVAVRAGVEGAGFPLEDLVVAPAGNRALLFNGVAPDPASPGRGAGFQSVTLNGAVAAEGNVVPLASSPTSVKFLAADEGGGSYRIATASLIGSNLATARVALRVGAVPAAELVSFDAATLPAIDLGPVGDLPFARGRSQWFGAANAADFVMAGPTSATPFTGDVDGGAAVSSKGIGFVWGTMVNGTFQLRASHVGVESLLPAEGAVQWAFVDRVGTATATETKFDVVYFDAGATPSDGGAATARVKHTVVSCRAR